MHEGPSKADLEELARLLGSIDDEYNRLMRWLGDLEGILSQPLPSGAGLDFLAIEAALKSARVRICLNPDCLVSKIQFCCVCVTLLGTFRAPNTW